ncbi:MAG TPA: glycoside hydrolase family 20 zincin-like fold domain-containing protein, partial [Gemmatimonadaceae bacterium]|nr:glycoside hydrolase family 20 zincin-like fold domain-containing protein [Gemmatimonadaceae bacterium]
MHDGRERRARRAALGTITALGTLAALAATGCTAARPAAAPTTMTAPTDTAPVYAVIPRPVRLVPGVGRFTLTPRTVIWTDAASAALGHQLVRDLEPATGFTLTVRSGGRAPARGIVLRLDPALDSLGSEGYVLDVTPARVLARAAAPAGLFYAVQTVRQLLPPAVFR